MPAPPAVGLEPLPLGRRRDADGPQLVRVASQVPGQPHAQLPRVQPVVLAPPLGTEPHGRGDQRHRSRRREFLVQRVAEAARLIHRVDGVPRRGLFPHPLHQLGPRELLRGLERAVIALDRRDAVVQVHVQPQHEAVGRCRLVSGAGCGCSGRVMRDCVCVHTTRRVPVLPTPRNPSWHLTASAPSVRASRECVSAPCAPPAPPRPSLSLGRLPFGLSACAPTGCIKFCGALPALLLVGG